MRKQCLVSLLALILPVSGLMAGTLTVTKDGPGDGYIKINNVGWPLPFSHYYPGGTSLTLEAVPTDSKSQFVWWSGYINSTDNPLTFTMPVLGNPSISASFTLSPPDIDYLFSVGSMASVFVGEYGEVGFDISNKGGQTLVVVSTSIIGPNASEFFIASGGGTFNLAAGASHRIIIGFTLVSRGEKTIYLEITSNDPDENPLLIYVFETGMLPPDIASDPASWDFGSVAIGGHSDKTFAVRNDGDGVLEVSSTTLTGPNASEFAILAGGGSFDLDGGQQRDVTVRFAPTSKGVKSASLTFNSNDQDENPFLVYLSGVGGAIGGPEYIAHFDQFPAYPYNTSSYKQGGAFVGCGPTTGAMMLGYFQHVYGLTDLLTNQDTGVNEGLNTAWALHGAAYMQTGSDGFGSVYRIKPGLENYVADKSYKLKVQIHAAPYWTAQNPGSLSQHGAYGDAWINDGTFWQAQADGSWKIDRTAFCDFLSPKLASGIPIFLTIDSDANGSADHWVALVGCDRATGQYAFYDTYSTTLKWADIYYCYDNAGSKVNSISYVRTVEFSPPDLPDIASSPASWDYGAVSTGSSLDKTFVISNTGTADLNVTAVTLSGANASEFHIQSGGGSFILAPAATRNVVVRFSPASSGVKNASLSFTSNDPDENPFLVSLTGGGGALIVIDGNKDDFYNILTGPENGYLNIPSPLYNLNGAPRDDRDLSARVWMAWDNTYLYLYEEVRDDTVHANNVTDWANDCLELKIDPDPSKQATEGVLTFNLTALDSVDTQPAFYSGIANLGDADKSDYARRRTADGYILELRVRWADMIISGRGPVIPAVGNVFGLAINQHDNDRSGRQASVQWSAKLADEVWFNPRLHGKVTFQAEHKLKMEARNAIIDTVVNLLASLYIPNGLPWPMLTMDVGTVQTAGSASYNDVTGTYTITGSGDDIWNQSDEFRYAFRQVSGKVELTARIDGLTKSDPWSKGGLMIRDELTANSAHAMMAVASDNGLTFQNRASTGAWCSYVAGNTTVKPPYWLKIVQVGNTFIGSASRDGASWVEVGRKVITMNDPVYVGMAVTAHHDGSLSTGTFSNVTFKFTDITEVEETVVSSVAPQEFDLSQNYPNPFNPVTRLSYDLPRQAAVKIVVYDVMGREVETLVNQIKPAGRYTIEFDASGLDSGIYFCDMRCDRHHVIRKMLLLR